MRNTNGEWYSDRVSEKDFKKWRVSLLVSSVVQSLERGSLSEEDSKSWNLLERSYQSIKEGR